MYKIILGIFLLISVSMLKADVGYENYELSDSVPQTDVLIDGGIRYNVFTKTYSLRNEDLIVDGQGLPIVVSRINDQDRSQPSLRVPFALGNWDLEIPRITAYRGLLRSDGVRYPSDAGPEVWSAGYCENPVFTQDYNDPKYDLHYWTGLQLDIPGDSTRELLFAEQETTDGRRIVYPKINVISGTKGIPEYITTDNWKAECFDLPQGVNSGFIVTTPNGTKYTFDVFASPQSKIKAENGWWETLGAYVYASRIEDVHGNSLNYEYVSDENGNLYVERITASDGRIVEFEYQPIDLSTHEFWRPVGRVNYLTAVRHISEVDGSVLKTINYGYYTVDLDKYAGDHLLSSVQTPDGKYWDYNYESFSFLIEHLNFYGEDCRDAVDKYLCHPTYSTVPAPPSYINTPSGASFIIRHDDSQILSNINGRFSYGQTNSHWVLKEVGLDKDGDNELEWIKFGTGSEFMLSLHSEREWGSLIFQNGYGVSEIVYPDGRAELYYTYFHQLAEGSGKTRARFTNLLGGLLRKKEIYSWDGTKADLLKSVEFSWEPGELVGDNARTCWINECDKPELYRKHLTSVNTAINGLEFNVTYSDYDEYGKPRGITENGNESKSATVTYYNNIDNWIIGLVEDEDIAGEGLVDRTFNSKGDLVNISKFGNIEEFEYYPSGELKARKWHKDSLSESLSIVYEDYYRGKPRLERHPENITINRDFYPTGLLKWEEDGNGNRTSYEYDESDRVVRVTPPEGLLSDIDWTSDDYERVESRYRYRSVTRRDKYDRPIYISEEDTSNDITKRQKLYKYDQMGRLLFASRYGYTTDSDYDSGYKYFYDALGRISKIIDTADNSEESYCYGSDCNVGREGRPEVKHGYLKYDSEGYESIYNYRSFGDPTEKALIEVVKQVSKNPLRYTRTTIERNKLNQITALEQGGVIRQYIYNDKKQLWKEVNPETGLTVYSYDLAGNLRTKTIGAVDKIVTNYFYDANNRLDYTLFPGLSGETLNYEYDDNGNVTEVGYGNVKRNFEYNGLNKITNNTLSVSGEVMTTQYVYDHYGHLESQTYPSGTTYDYEPNALGQKTHVRKDHVTTLADNLVYFQNGTLNMFEYGNGLSYKLSKNRGDLPEALTVNYQQNDNVISYGYDYYIRRNLKTIIDHKDSDNLRLTYDGLSRLMTANSSLVSVSVQYDDAGNIDSKTFGGVTYDFDYDSMNRLLTISNVYSFYYDVYGNVIGNKFNTFQYDDNGNLRKVNELNLAINYDGLKFKSSEQENDKETLFFYDDDGKLLYELNRETGNSNDYIYLQGKLLAKIDCDETDRDFDGDGIPNCFEMRWGLDGASSTDGTDDDDDDGISNYDEYLAKTNPKNSDTDGDGMDDGYELANNLNAKYDDSLLDLDGDGLNNFEEIFADSPPNTTFNYPWLIPVLHSVL